MAELNGKGPGTQLTVRHRGRIAQIRIFFKKFLRMFVYQSDWKMLPMAALIAGLVGFALGRGFGVNREGTLMGVFAVVCVCIWNGSFNSIQVVCRERDVIKREHRSGMHITSYIMAHMMYQLIMCVMQTVVTLFVLTRMGMQFPGKGMFTPWMVVDTGISMLLITYASDLLSLWISTLVHSTTTAMTIMPFVLIFQLVFSGGLFSLPKVVDPLMKLTISNPGLKALASQKQINDLPYGAFNSLLDMVDDLELGGEITVSQALGILSEVENDTIAQLRKIRFGNVMTLREVGEDLLTQDAYKDIREEVLTDDITVGALISALLESEELEETLSKNIGIITTIGEAVDFLLQDPSVQSHADEGLIITTTLGDILDLAGRDEIRARIEQKATEALYDPAYAYAKENILKNWLHILIFIAAFSALSVVTLEFIDKDKR